MGGELGPLFVGVLAPPSAEEGGGGEDEGEEEAADSALLNREGSALDVCGAWYSGRFPREPPSAGFVVWPRDA